jgi:hypothetical protein
LHHSVLSLSKHCASAELAANFLSDDNATKSRSNHNINLALFEERSNFTAQEFRLCGILKDFGTLKILRAMQPGR